MKRRDFLKSAGICTTLSLVDFYNIFPSDRQDNNRYEVPYYKKLTGGMVECLICPKRCKIVNQGRGYCLNKVNDNGFYYSLVYSRPCTINIDPIEKKPFYHFLPGSASYSLSTAGCNFGCRFCQNWQISQASPEELKGYYLSPTKVVEKVKEAKIPVIAFTYGEPIVFYEYMYDIAALARKQGIHNVMVSNGFINEEPLRELCQHLSAVKVDLKAFTDEFYQKYCNARLQPVLNTLLTLKKINIHFEIVVLIIPTLNDSPKEIRAMCEWIKNNLGDNIPVHFSRFNPMYKLTNLPMTPVKTLEDVYQIARESGLKFVYLGNIASHQAESTYCPSCQKILIKRVGYKVEANNIKDGKCPYCLADIYGVWYDKPR
ncbi:MAG: AmmeMemoRadiSam system radical SAM enzyme [Planctomycetota bacterium]|nr:AmmeMemoRadiSam system radical SAM enzyme [Planctomycetota bacterium]MDI6788176.1 AmmeMemoRadiSam system radical SAM enzyme [Planctomycetota bacterium]